MVENEIKVKKSKKKIGKSIKVDYKTYWKLVELKAKTHIPMAQIMKLAIEEFEKTK